METLLEEYALDDDEMGLDFWDGTNTSDTSKDTAPNNISDVRMRVLASFLFLVLDFINFIYQAGG